ncbi:MAG: MarR family transcriptional regulator [Anaerolineae bacterium]|nr:MarR family transcriptional regulator [Anaerolineae bacterium]
MDAQKNGDHARQDEARALEETLLRHSMRTMRRLAQELMAFDLTGTQYMTMAIIKRRGSCTMSELAEAMMHVSPTMTGIVSRLVGGGLLKRERDRTDRRVLRVSLTGQGEKLLEAVERHRHERFLEIFDRLPPGDRAEMLRLMKLYAQAADAGANDF